MAIDESRFHPGDGHVIDHDVLQLPPAILNSFDEQIDVALKPAFDAMWNAAGWAKSLNYDDKGRWVGQNRRH